MTSSVDEIIAAHSADIEQIDDAIIMEVVGVSQAVDACGFF